MRANLQRVSSASVIVSDRTIAQIASGLLVYVGVVPDDGAKDVQYVTGKIAHLRIFRNDAGKMNRSVLDVAGAVLLVSAFTVTADARKGRRPSFDSSASGDVARPLIEQLEQALRDAELTVETGEFGAAMRVVSENDGPISILIDSRGTI